MISIEPSESNKTISQSITQEMNYGYRATEEQCLQYYYYLTVDEDFDWGQQILILVRSDNETDNETEIDRVSVVDMIDNRWNWRNITFTSPSSNYTVTEMKGIENIVENIFLIILVNILF